MADTPQEGETATPKVLENQTATPPAETPKGGDQTAVEELRKELEQSKMRANQLANELEAKRKAEEEAQAKQLEEQNKFKELYEQEKLTREQIEAERQDEIRKRELEAKQNEVLAGYPTEVRALALETGISLDSVDNVDAFKEKLDKIDGAVGAKVGPNNPRTSNDKVEFSGEDLRAALKKPGGLEEIVAAKYPSIASMMKQPE